MESLEEKALEQVGLLRRIKDEAISYFETYVIVPALVGGALFLNGQEMKEEFFGKLSDYAYFVLSLRRPMNY